MRYYDEIDLLKPARVSSNGYRVYGQKEIDRLQQIMLYRELGVPLEDIKNILGAKTLMEKKHSEIISQLYVIGESKSIYLLET